MVPPFAMHEITSQICRGMLIFASQLISRLLATRVCLNHCNLEKLQKWAPSKAPVHRTIDSSTVIIPFG